MNRRHVPVLLIALILLALPMPGSTAGPVGAYDHVDCHAPDGAAWFVPLMRDTEGARFEYVCEGSIGGNGEAGTKIRDDIDSFSIHLFEGEYFYFEIYIPDCPNEFYAIASITHINGWHYDDTDDYCEGGRSLSLGLELDPVPETGTYSIDFWIFDGDRADYLMSYRLNGDWYPAPSPPALTGWPANPIHTAWASAGKVGQQTHWSTSITPYATMAALIFDWGDGTTTRLARGEGTQATHTFGQAGSYCVRAVVETNTGRLGQSSPCHQHTVSSVVSIQIEQIAKIADIGLSQSATATLRIESGTLRTQVASTYLDVPLVVPRANGLPNPTVLNQNVPPVSTTYTLADPCHRIAGTCQLTLGYQAGTDFVKVGEVWQSRLDVIMDGQVIQSSPFVEVRL